MSEAACAASQVLPLVRMPRHGAAASCTCTHGSLLCMLSSRVQGQVAMQQAVSHLGNGGSQQCGLPCLTSSRRPSNQLLERHLSSTPAGSQGSSTRHVGQRSCMLLAGCTKTAHIRHYLCRLDMHALFHACVHASCRVAVIYGTWS